MLRMVGHFIAYWVGLTICFTLLSLFMSGFVLVHVVVGFGFVAAIAWMLIDRWLGARARSRS